MFAEKPPYPLLAPSMSLRQASQTILKSIESHGYLVPFAERLRRSYFFAALAQVNKVLPYARKTPSYPLRTGIAYCSSEHQEADWTSSHRSECRVSNPAKHPRGHRADAADLSSPLIRVILPLPRTFETVEPGFTNFDNPIDRLKPPSKSSTKSQCRKTIYGPGERFIIRARWGGHADRIFGVTAEDRLSGKPIMAKDPQYQSLLDVHMSWVLFPSRPCRCHK